MREIPLNKGRVTSVDDEDFDWLAQYHWFWVPNTRTGYAHRHGSRPEKHTFYMHREILQAPVGIDVDHINNDGLDNQKHNLRLATRGQNLASQHHATPRPYRGVYPLRSRWKAQATFEQRSVHLGVFETPEEAARAYDAFAKANWGPFATLNFGWTED
jgi:hypothetical protein